MRNAFLSLVALLALAALVASCGGDDDDDSTSAPTATASPTATATSEPTPAPTQTAEPGPPPVSDVTWSDILGETSAPDGWTVEVGEGTGTFLDVTDETGALVGYVELLAYPRDSFTFFTSDDPIENLLALAEDYYNVFEEDRTLTFGEGYEFDRDEPEEVAVGELSGLRFGFTGTLDGEIADRTINHVVIDGDWVYLIGAIYDRGIAEEQGFRTPEGLEEFASHLGAIVESLRFPIS